MQIYDAKRLIETDFEGVKTNKFIIYDAELSNNMYIVYVEKDSRNVTSSQRGLNTTLEGYMKRKKQKRREKKNGNNGNNNSNNNREQDDNLEIKTDNKDSTIHDEENLNYPKLAST